MPRLALLATPLLTLLLSAIGCAGPEGGARDVIAANEGELDIVGTALVIGHCGRFAGAVKRSGLDELFSGDGPFTVFVPIDEAFLSLDGDTRRALDDDVERLRAVLRHHVVEGDVRAPELIHASTVTPVSGPPLEVRIVDQQAMVGTARIVRGDVVARNGVIHFVDTVLLPESAAPSSDG